MYKATTAFQKINNLTKKIRVVQGGTSASKTISILLYLIGYAQSDKTKTLTSIVAESVPHLKRGAMRDFRKIMETHGYWKDANWNATDSIYTFETGSQIEFFSTDNGDKLRGARRDRLFMNEANNNTFDAFEQLEVRTKEFVILDYNPTSEFWVHTDVLNKRNDVEFIILTYKDNEALPPEIVASIEQRKDRKGWWQVYGEGQLGEVEGKIYKDWAIIDEIPHEARLERYGLDFGYSNDPTAIVAIYRYNGGFIFDEITYQKGLSNKQIADILNNQPKALVIADSAEPKSIDEIKSYGVNILPAQKGAGSINQGIQFVQDQRCSVSKRSTNLIKEYRNYMWKRDRDGKVLNVPEDLWNHCFAPETLVHTTKGKIRIDELVGKSGYLYTRNGGVERFFDVRATRKNAEVVSVHFEDGETLTVTPDHLLLKDNGEWVEAGLLNPMDLIQSGIYEGTSIRWKGIQTIQWREVLQPWKKKIAQGYMGISQWLNTKWVSYSSHRQESRKQFDRELGVEEATRAPFRTRDARKEGADERMGGEDSTPYKEMALLKGGEGMAQQARSAILSIKETYRKGVLSLPQKIYNKTILKNCKILSSKLQNESTKKKITKVTRGFCEVVYNLEVENTHCLIANGVVAHNCLDAARYGLSDYKQPAPNIFNQLGSRPVFR